MKRKRGLVVVVLISLFLILSGIIVEAISPAEVSDAKNKVTALGKKVNAAYSYGTCNVGDHEDCWYDGEGLRSDGYENAERYDDNERLGITVEKVGPGFGGNCDLDGYIVTKPSIVQGGCNFLLVDIDSGSNDGARAIIKHGTYLGRRQDGYDILSGFYVTNELKCDEDDATEGIDGAGFRSDGIDLFMCSSDNYWHICQDDKDKAVDNTGKEKENNEATYYGSFTYVNNKVYNCSEWDYLTNPDEPTKTEIVTWRELPGLDKDNDGFTDKIGDCRDDPANDPLVCEDLESSEDCSNIKYSSCAICINPDQTEIGGDGIDNSCRTGKKEDGVLNIDDDMDSPAYRDVCISTLSWVDKPVNKNDKNFCCGDDGITDLGKTINTNSGEYICLINNDKLVKLPETITNGWKVPTVIPTKNEEGGTITIPLDGVPPGELEWNWVLASGNAKFTILTLNKPGEKSYDVISNGGKWKACSQGTEGILESSLFEVFGSGDKYRCLATENQDIWAECCKEGVSCQSASGADGTKADNINGIKIRHPGQGLFDLLPFLKDNSIHFSSMGGSTAYADIYGKRYPSFAGFAYLDIYFQFADETIPAEVSLQLEVFSPSGKIASENVLSHIVNGAAIEGKRTYHAQIPISGWRDVTILSFVTTPQEVKIEFKDIHAAKEGDDPVCSSDSAWLDSLDSPSSGVEPGKMCEDLGLQWLGDAAAEPSLRCCGNTAGEYGIGDGKGCWNSQGIKAEETANNVQVELTYGKGEWSYGVAEADVSAVLVLSENEITVAENVNFQCDFYGNYVVCYLKEGSSAKIKPQDLVFKDGNFHEVPNEGAFSKVKKAVIDFFSGGLLSSSYDTAVSLTSYGYTCKNKKEKIFCFGDPLSDNVVDYSVSKENKVLFKEVKISSTSTHYIKQIATSNPTLIEPSVTFTKTNFVEASLKDISGGKVYFFDPLKDDQYSYDDEKTTIKYEDLEQEKTTYYIMAEANTLKQKFSYNPKITETLTYSCRFDSSQPACTFPLKGSAPYTLKNLFPQKYDLYFVVKTAEGQEIRTFINTVKTVYAPNGWLEAVNLPQQALFDGKAFMGCGDTASLAETPLTAEKFCSAKKLETSGFYCSPEGSWKNDELKVTGYDENNNLQFLPDASPQKPEERTHLSSVVFGRNLLLNPMLDLTK